MRNYCWLLGSVMLLGVSGCDPDVGSSALELVPDAGSTPQYLTVLPDGWRQRCRSIRTGPLLESCQALGAAPNDTEAERHTFELNYEASQRGILPRSLAELHFTHGQFTGFSVRDLDRELRQSPDDAEYLDLARSVNRAFIEGHDAGVLAEWIATPICGDTQEIDGPANAPCGMLDGACLRGVFQDGCCLFDAAPIGAVCTQDDGASGLCDENGACAPPGSVPEEDRIRGALAWIEHDGDGNAVSWDISSMLEPRQELTRISIASDEELHPEVPEEDPTPGDFVPVWGGDVGDPLAEIATEYAGVRRARVSRRAATDLSASAIDIGQSAGARTLYVAGAPARVCVVAGKRVDELGPVLSDCTSAGTTSLACPGEAGGLRCELIDGAAKITGDMLTLAFDVPDATDPIIDVMPIVLPSRICADPGCVRVPIHDSPIPHVHFPRRPPSCAGTECPCGYRGRPVLVRGGFPVRGPSSGFFTCGCFQNREICDGDDNDCDLAIDEGADLLCSDGIACTQERCEGTAGCVAGTVRENAAFCTPAYCAQGMCNGEAPPDFPTWLPRTAPDGNGCQLTFDNDFCEFDWDRCQCNGMTLCSPSFAASEGQEAAYMGCSELAGGPATWPCDWDDPSTPQRESDGNLCTLEYCCEPNNNPFGFCRHLLSETQPLAGTVILDPRVNPLCDPQLTRPGTHTPWGPPVACVQMEDFLTPAERIALGCNDNNACTIDTCTNPTSRFAPCSHGPEPSGTTTTPHTISFSFPTPVGSIPGGVLPLDPGCSGSFGQCGAWECNSSGVCIHPTDSMLCADALDCTTDSCDPITGDCSNVPIGACVIQNTCIPDGSGLLGRECYVCQSSINPSGWTFDSANWCEIGGACVAEGTSDASGCSVCDPDRSTSGYVPRVDCARTPRDPCCLM